MLERLLGRGADAHTPLFHVGGYRSEAQALDDPERSLNLRVCLDGLACVLPEIIGPDRGGARPERHPPITVSDPKAGLDEDTAQIGLDFEPRHDGADPAAGCDGVELLGERIDPLTLIWIKQAFELRQGRREPQAAQGCPAPGSRMTVS